MKNLQRQCFGIDCAKDDFAVTFSVCDDQQAIEHLSSSTFKNTDAGFKAFNKWSLKFIKTSHPVLFVMEATGVYHERLACFLFDSNYNLAVVLPNRAKDFSKTMKVKTTNDKISSQYLATMGLEKKLDLWKKPDSIYIRLRKLTRERSQVMGLRTEIKNHIHAETSGAWPNQKTLRRLKSQNQLLNKQLEEITADIKEILQENAELKRRVEKITTIPGVGELTVVSIVSETNGFNSIKNKRQLVSYAGYDVLQHTSGSSVKSKARISKRGNRHIRRAMHMPALTAIRHNNKDKDMFIRIVSKTGIKMKGVVAIQRKLLVLIYTLWKNDTAFDPEYEEKKGQSSTTLNELDLVRS